MRPRDHETRPHRRASPPRLRRLRRPALAAGLTAGAFLSPLPAAAHSLSGRVDSPLPLEAYLAGAAVAVALSFAFVALGDAGPEPRVAAGRIRTVPALVRMGLRLAGLVGWLWVTLQTIIGGSSQADVASLFLWVYGWVALPIVCALVGPVWSWLDPFSSIHDMGAWLVRKLGVRPPEPRPYPAWLGAWPAVIGLAVLVWFELAARVADGRPLGIVMLAYTVVTLAGMAQYGRDAWRANAEVFSVWLGLAGRLALFAAEGPPQEGRVRRQGFGAGLAAGVWTAPLVTVVAVATGSIIFDGLSQTQAFLELFGIPGLPGDSLLLMGFLALLAAIMLAVSRLVGLAAVGAGLVPVALGYLVAHYLTLLLFDGQRIAVALSDPFQQGWDLFGTAYWQVDQESLPVSLIWSLQVGAVILGHVVGAWTGHAAIRSRRRQGDPVRGWPLAVLMVGLTCLTLWSLGQNLVFEAADAAGAVRVLALP